MSRRDWHSPRLAAYAVAASALVVLATLVVGGADAVRQARAVEGVRVERVDSTAFGSPASPVACLGQWCAVAWRVTATEGPVRLDRVVLTDLGPGSSPSGRRLLGAQAGSTDLTIPRPTDAVAAARENAAVPIGTDVPDGGSVRVTVVLELAQQCPPGGFAPVPAVLTVSRGGVVDQHRPAPAGLPCR